MEYIIRAISLYQKVPYYLKEDERGYRWHKGAPGRELAKRFDSREDAQAVIDNRHLGRAGGKSEIVEVDE